MNLEERKILLVEELLLNFSNTLLIEEVIRREFNALPLESEDERYQFLSDALSEARSQATTKNMEKARSMHGGRIDKAYSGNTTRGLVNSAQNMERPMMTRKMTRDLLDRIARERAENAKPKR